MNLRIGTNDAVKQLRAAGFHAIQMDLGTLLAYRDGECYGFRYRRMEGGNGYNAEAVSALAAQPRPAKAA